ncbi:MAG: biotin--[acetyl-CoA-carboxylase] ligase, partial [Erysipelotrichaceae bacterium]|nr:biotin--[acetyl-CoA-carboxylase] ligase [Erysipelotrichaceae bacterium]
LMNPVLNQKQLAEKLHPFFKPIVIESTDSTSTWVRSHLHVLAEGTVLFAREQTAGRGRGSHSFTSNKDCGLYLTLLLKPAGGQDLFLPVSLKTAAAAAHALTNLYGVPVGIKWVNDLMIENRKIGGILCESVPLSKGRQALMIGIGINVCSQQFPGSLQNTAASLQDFVPEAGLNETAAALLNTLYEFLQDPDESSIHKIYKDHFILAGRTVTVDGPSGRYAAKVLDVDLQGRLTVLKGNQKISLAGSEIHIRPVSPEEDSV